jgi:hypothetical protein
MKIFEILGANESTNVLTAFRALPGVVQYRMLKHYKIKNPNAFSALSPRRQELFAQDVRYYSKHGVSALKPTDDVPPTDMSATAPQNAAPSEPVDPFRRQAGQSPSDLEKYPPSSPFRRQAG